MKTLRTLLLGGLGLLAVSLPLGCSLFSSAPPTIEDLRAYVRNEVAEPERASAMIEQIDLAETRLGVFHEELGQLGSEMRRVNADRSAEREEVDALFLRHNEIRGRIQEELLDAMVTVRDLASQDEWDDLVDMSLQAYGAQIAKAGLTSSVAATEEQDG